MGRLATATLNYQLTRFAQGFSQDMQGLLADFLAPEVPVQGASGQYKVFDDINSFQTYNTDLPASGDARRIQFEATDATYVCLPNALEVTVPRQEREMAGDSPLAQQLLDEGKIKALLNATRLSKDKKIIDFIVANTTAIADRGNWSNKDIDPIEQLDEQIDALGTATGSMQNLRLAIGLTPWRTLRNHPKVKARCTGVQVGGITLEQLKSILMFPVEIRLGVLSVSSTKPGQTMVKANMVGQNVILTYASPNPTVYDPSGFKVFTTGKGRVDAVFTYQAPSTRYDVHSIDWSECVKQTSTIATKRFAIT